MVIPVTSTFPGITDGVYKIEMTGNLVSVNMNIGNRYP